MVRVWATARYKVVFASPFRCCRGTIFMLCDCRKRGDSGTDWEHSPLSPMPFFNPSGRGGAGLHHLVGEGIR